MIFRFIFRQKCVTHQKSLLECGRTLQCQALSMLRLSNSTEVNEQIPETASERKILKVAFVGRPNAGKSSLINCILNLNICGVSQKTHTTKTDFKAAFIQGDTQLVFMDTPGLITQKEYSRFNLSKDFLRWKEKVIKEADIIGVLHEVSGPEDVFKFHSNLIQNITELPETKPLFLVFSKIDLVLDKEGLSAALAELLSPYNVQKSHLSKASMILGKFSKIFYTSTKKNEGVFGLVNYLLEKAKPGKWIFEPGQVFDKPLDLVVIDLLRAQLLEVLPQEIPYTCKFEIEYLKENNWGEIICVALITFKRTRHLLMLTKKRNFLLKNISRNLESDLYKILKKVFKIRIVAVSSQKLQEKDKVSDS